MNIINSLARAKFCFVLAAINVGQNGLGQIPLLMDIAGYLTTVD